MKKKPFFFKEILGFRGDAVIIYPTLDGHNFFV